MSSDASMFIGLVTTYGVLTFSVMKVYKNIVNLAKLHIGIHEKRESTDLEKQLKVAYREKIWKKKFIAPREVPVNVGMGQLSLDD